MEQSGDRIFIHHTDPAFDLPAESPSVPLALPRRFTHNEEFFLTLQDEIEVPSFAIHHDVTLRKPETNRSTALLAVKRQILAQAPGLFAGTRWYFDPTDVLALNHYQLLRVGESAYLVLLRINLANRTDGTRVITRGTNDFTASYATRRLFIESDIVPLVSWRQSAAEEIELKINQPVSETWVGETGRGYFVQGIWLDREITKFFTRLFLPEGRRLYPYYPLSCKYRSICMHPVDLDLDGRRKAVALLHHCQDFLERHLKDIEKALHSVNFSDDLPLYRELRNLVPERLRQPFAPLSMMMYLNEHEMKEYELHYDTN